ncbi:MAG: VWA domain-containing protein [Bacteroidota bacterium]
MKKILFYIIAAFLLPHTSFSQVKPVEKPPPPTTRILFIFDASYSMYGKWQSDTKMIIAKKLLSELLDSLKSVPNIELALRCYGHQSQVPPQDCNDSRLEIPFAKNNVERIKNKIKVLIPKGTTPIARSLELCANDFPPIDNNRNVVILITDGIEECNGDPCKISQELQKKGIIIKPFVIGIGIKDKSQFECIGKFFDAEEEQSFRNVLRVVITQVLNPTTVQVNLMDIAGKPTETNVPMTFYDSYSGLPKYNLVHTMNYRGYPDTLMIDPLLTYDLVVHTLPSVRRDTIRLYPGKHSVIAVDAPQGNLYVRAAGKQDFKNIEVIVRQTGDPNTLNVQNFNQTVRYLVGKYDIEILTIPRISMKAVDISQSKTTNVEVPQPGLVNLQLPTPGYGCILYEDNGKLTNVLNIPEYATSMSVYLLPGQYRATFRGRAAKESYYTLNKKFKVEPGVSVNVKMY